MFLWMGWTVRVQDPYSRKKMLKADPLALGKEIPWHEGVVLTTFSKKFKGQIDQVDNGRRDPTPKDADGFNKWGRKGRRRICLVHR